MTTSVVRSTADGTSTVRCTTEPAPELGVLLVIDRSEGRDIDSMIPARAPRTRNPRRSEPAIAQDGQYRGKGQTAHDRRVERDRRRQPHAELLELEQRQRRED